jgi:hypothetical protein
MGISQVWIGLVAAFGAIAAAIAALISVFLNRRELRMRLRPWVGVAKWNSSDIRAISPGGPIYEVSVAIRNFGSLPAFDVAITCSIRSENQGPNEVVKRSGLLLWPMQDEDLGWSILPPLSKETRILTEVTIVYRLTPTAKGLVHTKQLRQYYTGSMKFVDAEEAKSYAD